MRIQLAAMVLTAAIGGGVLSAAEKPRVDVYLNGSDDSEQLLGPGRALASGIFEQIGVHLVWHYGELTTAKGTRKGEAQLVFAIRTLAHPLESATSDALASARIVGTCGTEICIYEDRLAGFIADHPDWVKVAAAYVLAHELAHVMQGVARHSESGILKAHWTKDDFKAMVFHKLSFTDADVDLIHRGVELQLAGRRSGPAAQRGEGVAENGGPNAAERVVHLP